MASGDRDDQAGDAACAHAADASGRAAPAAQRKQQGSSRQFLGAYGKSVDAERLVQLRKDNLEYRQEREKNEERKRKKNEEMAEAYRKHKAEAAAKAKEERRNQLARLEAQNQRRAERALVPSQTPRGVYSDDGVDEEYRMLLERYGDRVRVPNVPLDPWKQQNGSTMDSVGSRSKEASPRKPTIPKPKARAPNTGAGVAMSSTADAAGRTTGSADKKAQSQSRSSCSQQGAPAPGRRPSQMGGGQALPGLASNAASPRGGATGHRLSSGPHGNAIKAAAAQAAAARAADPLAGDSVMSEVPEPERSLMPRKDALRKFQQSLIKKTDVSFYKVHMKRHFRRILEATELTFSDTTGRREQAMWNLAKPLSMAELKQLSSVTVIDI